ncbi:hypothetical protein B9Z19DRAFT_1100390 [Tuber borchii]|uniref:Uncharacterized protein n=1 Tax=Tuber borchii TaxID=42251 RepID=A0A2T6ZXH7_TUBBO|nr:hypothetical protein B9Z19DRAFT_1100390 [Tuber borchii]
MFVHKFPAIGRTLRFYVKPHLETESGAASIFVENKDSCLLNKCGAEKKFFIMELCDDILVDTVVLVNFGLKIFDRDRYPIKRNGWKDVSTFEARNSRGTSYGVFDPVRE